MSKSNISGESAGAEMTSSSAAEPESLLLGGAPSISAAANLEHYNLLYKVGIALAAERNREKLIETILLEAKRLCHADGGTLYLRSQADCLKFAILRTESLGLALGGTSERPIDLPPIPLKDPISGEPNLSNVATAAANENRVVNIIDAYDADGFDFSGTRQFDARNHYRSKSFLAIPLRDSQGAVIGVLQLINASDPVTREIIPFSSDLEKLVEALTAQAGIALENHLLVEQQEKLLDSLIKLLAEAIDSKSPYTGGHCERVPVLGELLMKKVCEETSGKYAGFQFTAEEWREFRVAAWLHDCGKITTPVHVMDKATKLETISDRIETVRVRFELKKREVELLFLKSSMSSEGPSEWLENTLAELDEEFEFIRKCNTGGEFLGHEAQARIREISERTVMVGGVEQALLTPDEVYNLSISRGTLTAEERIEINGHMVQTIRMLESLPFPSNLRRVPEYAGGHHEKMDGSGYPKGLFASDMSIPARALAIADVFEALTAQDRPYKKGKSLSVTMDIMGQMKKHNHLDPDLFNLFVKSRVYIEYAEKYLPPELIDEVDEKMLLEIVPVPFPLPSDEERLRRWAGFLPEYRGSKR